MFKGRASVEQEVVSVIGQSGIFSVDLRLARNIAFFEPAEDLPDDPLPDTHVGRLALDFEDGSRCWLIELWTDTDFTEV